MFVKVLKPLPECEKEEGLEFCTTCLVGRKLGKPGWSRTVQGAGIGRSEIRFTNQVDYFTMSGLAVCAWFDMISIHLDAP
jgi:hypothetical protein